MYSFDCNIPTVHQFNASLLIKNMYFFQKQLTTKLLNGAVYIYTFSKGDTFFF